MLRAVVAPNHEPIYHSIARPLQQTQAIACARLAANKNRLCKPAFLIGQLAARSPRQIPRVRHNLWVGEQAAYRGRQWRVEGCPVSSAGVFPIAVCLYL
jgi:hypothetical protein